MKLVGTDPRQAGASGRDPAGGNRARPGAGRPAGHPDGLLVLSKQITASGGSRGSPGAGGPRGSPGEGERAVATPESGIGPSDHYKWIALSNTTLGMLVGTINASIVLISLPAIFRGIELNPLAPGNVSYLLWMLMGYLLVTAVLVVTLRPARRHLRPGADLQPGLRGLHPRRGRARRSTRSPAGRGALADRLAGRPGRRRRHAVRQLDRDPDRRLPANQRGMALGVNQVAGIAGSFIGLILGGVLAASTGARSSG